MGSNASARSAAAFALVLAVVLAPLPALGAPDYSPNDPYASQQYALSQTRLREAWDTTLGDLDARVCIVGQGVRATHEDIAGARWLGGWDFVDNDATPQDTFGYGTMQLGVAAATINNGKGVAGAANVGMHAARVLGPGATNWALVEQGVEWCAAKGPRTVLLLAFGCAGCYHAGTAAAIDRAVAEDGLLAVADAGYEGCDWCVDWPATMDNVIAVSCTDYGEVLCAEASTGPEVDLAAPGVTIDGPWGGGDAQYEVDDNSVYSAAYVAGALALYWSWDTAISNAALRERLLHAAQDLGSTGRDRSFGCGELDAARLFAGTGTCADPPPPVCDATPPNDCFASSTYYPAGSYSNYQSTTGGVMESGEPTGCGVGASVWYSFTASADGTAEVKSEGSFFDTVLAVYTGATLGSLALVDCNDNAHSGVTWSRVTFACTKGTTYRVQAGGRDGREGGLEFRHSGCRGTTLPTAPLALHASPGSGAGQITLTWSAPASNGNATLLGYFVHGADAASGPFSNVGETPAGTLTFTESALGNGRTRHYRVTARNPVGEGPASATATATTLAPPSPPRNVDAGPSFPLFSIDVAWEPPASNGGRLDGYDVLRGTAPGGPFVRRGTVGPTVTEYHDANVEPLETYWYVVRAKNAAGPSGDSNVACAMALPTPFLLDGCA